MQYVIFTKLQLYLKKQHECSKSEKVIKGDVMKDNQPNQYFMFHILNLHTQNVESKNA